MNQKSAFKILGLRPGASLVQAKKAFRNLAKQYHPDRHPSDLYPSDLYPSDEILSVRAEARMTKMKQINQAFHFLAPLLASDLSGKASKKPPPIYKKKKTQSKTDPLFQDLLKMLKKGLKLKFSRKAEVRRRPGPSVKQPLKSKVQRKSRAGKRDRFATILHTLHPGASVDKKNRDNGLEFRVQARDSNRLPRDSSVNPYGNFMKYMALKKTIDARTRREQNPGRIEKIGPVTRVNPIGDKNKS